MNDETEEDPAVTSAPHFHHEIRTDRMPQPRAIKRFIIVVLLAMCFFGWILFQLIDNTVKTNHNVDAIKKLADSNAKLIEQIQDLQASNHIAALQRDAAIQAQVKFLACILIRTTPNDPKVPQIAQFRLLFTCPPFDPNARNKPLPTKLPPAIPSVPNNPTPTPGGPGGATPTLNQSSPNPGQPSPVPPNPSPAPPPRTSPVRPPPTPPRTSPIVICLPVVGCKTL